MSSVAGFSLLLAFVCSLGALIVSAYGMYRDHRPSYGVLRRTLGVLPLLLGLSCGIMVYEFVAGWTEVQRVINGQTTTVLATNFKYVAANSSADLPLLYRVTGIWSGQSGSLLFWSFILSLYGFFLVLQTRDQPPNLFYGSTLIALLAIQSFFLYLLNGVTYPFSRLWEVPAGSGNVVSAASPPPGGVEAFVQGSGLNPVLQHPGMAIHPPMLYLGYIGLAVPFCFAFGALISGRLGDEWIRQSRVWTLFSWTILSFGIVLGGWWAYQELGWGGYWAWDPVENASFMPWLMSTAFVHSVMIQERRNMLKRWNLILVSLAFVLSIFGTFLTRSGLLSSVHTFAEDPVIGGSFLAFLGVLLSVIIGLTIWRYGELEAESELDSVFSREFAFLLNNIVLVGICFAVFWGTTYPIISEVLTGERVSLGPSFFNQVTIPMFLLLLLLSGIGPLISWRKASLSNLTRNFSLPVAGALLTAGVLWAWGFYRWLPVATFSICSFVLVTIVAEFYRGTRARMRSTGEPPPLALLRLTWKARRRFGGYVVHFAVVLMAVGIAASSAYQAELQATLKPGEQVTIRGYTLTYRGMNRRPISNGTRFNARVEVQRNNRRVGVLTPGIERLNNSRQPRVRVDIRSTLADDLYLVLTDWTRGSASLQVYHNPLVNLLWIGILVLLAGGLYAFLPLPG